MSVTGKLLYCSKKMCRLSNESSAYRRSTIVKVRYIRIGYISQEHTHTHPWVDLYMLAYGRHVGLLRDGFCVFAVSNTINTAQFVGRNTALMCITVRCSWALFTDCLRPIRCSLHYWYLMVFYTDGSPSVIAPAFSTPAFSAPPCLSWFCRPVAMSRNCDDVNNKFTHWSWNKRLAQLLHKHECMQFCWRLQQQVWKYIILFQGSAATFLRYDENNLLQISQSFQQWKCFILKID